MEKVAGDLFGPTLSINRNQLIGFDFEGDVPNQLIQGKKLVIQDCSFSNVDIICRFVESISFINCSFDRLILMLDLACAIEFIDCTAKYIDVKCTDVFSPSCKFAGSKTSIDEMWIHNGRFESLFFGENSNFGVATIELSRSNRIVLSSTKGSQIIIRGQTDVITLMNLSQLKNVSLDLLNGRRVAVSKCSNLNLFGDSINFSDVIFSDVVDLSLHLTNVQIGKVLAGGECTFSRIDLNENFDCNFEVVERLSIGAICLFRTVVPDGKSLVFRSTTFDQLTCRNVINAGRIEFINSEVVKSLFFLESDLGKMMFTNTTLQRQCDVRILKCRIDAVEFNTFRWNRDYRLNENYDEAMVEIFRSENDFLYCLRETYRQLKNNYQKNGNKIESLEFQRGEMNAHFRLLRVNRNDNFWNYLIVGTNRWFSDFGQNIWKPIIFLFVIHLFLFNILLWTSDIGIELRLSNTNITPQSIWKGVNLYFQTLLPTHFATVKPFHKGADVSIGGAIDFLMRISSAYFIYYFVSASRKYHSS
jgi:hypothetical protein